MGPDVGGGEDIAYGGVLYRVADGICTITLNRPERLNALDHGPGSLQGDMTDAMERANVDPAVRCIVVTGAGKAFSAGGYIRGPMPENALEWYEFMLVQDRENERVRALDKPVIGAINGICYGAALIMLCNFDFLIAVDTAEIGFIETRFGLPAAETLAYLVGPQWARFLVLSGELLSARKAKEIGLLLETFPEPLFMPKVYDLARRIASVPPAAAMFQRRIVNAALENMGWLNQKATANALNALLATASEDHRTPDGRRFTDLQQEGWKVFKEARDAPFQPPWFDA